VRAHAAIPPALRGSATAVSAEVALEWLPTESIGSGTSLDRFHGLWCVPGSPYADMDGVLTTIRFAREHGTPFLGTCAGFQHALIEYARHVAGVGDADHAESNPSAQHPVVVALSCALDGQQGTVRLSPGSGAATLYGRSTVQERYRCNYGLNPAYAGLFTSGGLAATGWDEANEVRVVELAGHPFFLATLFQPELSAQPDRPHPLVTGFVAAAVRHASGHTLAAR
jgi:CTP synthase (UTP-ammonia lyase)